MSHTSGRPRRRAHARFEAAVRVEYTFDGSRVLAFSRTLSAGGMLLANTGQIAPQAEIEFCITLPDLPATPVRIRGRVVSISRRGAHVQFHANQAQASARIRKFAAGTIMPQLSAEMGKDGIAVRRVCELAELLVDFGRTEEAMALYRRKVAEMGGERLFCEHMAWLWVEQKETAPAAKASGLVDELRALLERGSAFTDSAILQMARERLEGSKSDVTATAPPAPRPKDTPTPANRPTAPTTTSAATPNSAPRTAASALLPDASAATPSPEPPPVAPAALATSPAPLELSPPSEQHRAQLAALAQAAAFATQYSEAEAQAAQQSTHMLRQRINELENTLQQTLAELQRERAHREALQQELDWYQAHDAMEEDSTGEN